MSGSSLTQGGCEVLIITAKLSESQPGPASRVCLYLQSGYNIYLQSWHMTLYDTDQYERHPDDGEADQRGAPPAHLVPQRPEQVRADQVAADQSEMSSGSRDPASANPSSPDGGGEEGGPQLPLLAAHVLHHVDGEARLQHRDPHVGEGDRARAHQDVRVLYQRAQTRRRLVRFYHLHKNILVISKKYLVLPLVGGSASAGSRPAGPGRRG